MALYTSIMTIVEFHSISENGRNRYIRETMSFLSTFLTVYSSREHVGCQKGNKQMWEIYQVHSELLQTIYVRTAEQAEAAAATRY